MERVQCDGCGVTELHRGPIGGLPKGWRVMVDDDELRCPECAAGAARVRQVNATQAHLAGAERGTVG